MKLYNFKTKEDNDVFDKELRPVIEDAEKEMNEFYNNNHREGKYEIHVVMINPHFVFKNILHGEKIGCRVLVMWESVCMNRKDVPTTWTNTFVDGWKCDKELHTSESLMPFGEKDFVINEAMKCYGAKNFEDLRKMSKVYNHFVGNSLII